jgi:hypothetical protein
MLSVLDESECDEQTLVHVHSRWLRLLSRLSATPFESQRNFECLMRLRHAAQKRLYAAFDRFAHSNDPMPVIDRRLERRD